VDIDYKEEERQFLKELNDGKFAIEILENEGMRREEKEASDIAAYEAYLDSNDFKSFCEVAHRK